MKWATSSDRITVKCLRSSVSIVRVLYSIRYIRYRLGELGVRSLDQII